jgi:hypothetical protein
MNKTYRILSIDAWRECDGYTWNAWYDVGDIDVDASHWNARKLLKYFRDNGFLSEKSAGKCAIDDDQYNIVIVERSTRRPLFAIEYGVDN